MGDEAGTQLADADFVDICNDSQIAINNEVKMIRGAQNTNTVAGTTLYAVPADYVMSINLSINDFPENLRQISVEELNQMNRYRLDTSQKGRPILFYVDGMNYGFYPTPDAVYATTLNYVKLPTTLAVIGDALTLPAFMHPAVVTYALSIAKQRDEEFDVAEQIRNRAVMEAIDAAYIARNGNGESYNAVREWDVEIPHWSYL